MGNKFKLGDDVWLAAVNLFQLAMFTNQDFSATFQDLEVMFTDAGTLSLTPESAVMLNERIQAFATIPEPQPPELDEDAPVFVIGKV